MPNDLQSDNKAFQVVNDIILGPIYKQVLLAHLRTTPATPEAATKNHLLITRQTSKSSRGENKRDKGPTIPELTHNPTLVLTSNEEADWPPEKIGRILRACGGFSVGAAADLEEVRRTESRCKLPKDLCLLCRS